MAWRKHMAANGYSSVTILNYVKYINCYLDFVGCSEIRFNRGKGKDISGITFGYLTALDPALPSRDTEPMRDFLPTEWVTNDKLLSAAKRIDNSSGHTGVSLVRNRWQASICHEGIRYILGSFDTQEGAVNAREQAEQDLIVNPDGFAEIYQKKCRYYIYVPK